MNIDSEAQQDLALADDEAEGVTGGKEVARKAAKHQVTRKGPLHVGAPPMIVQTVTYGTPTASANSGDDDCAPEVGGDPGNQDGAT